MERESNSCRFIDGSATLENALRCSSTCSNLIAKAEHHVPRGERLEGEIVVAGVGETVPVVAHAPLVGEQAVLTQLLQQLVHATVPQVRNLGNQRTRN